MDLTIGFLGLGLIGGSIAKGLRRYHSNFRLIAYNHNYGTALLALSEGIIDEAVKEVDHSFSDCDILYLCMPVSYNVEYLKKIKPFLKDSCILTDVGSVKGNIHEAVKALGLEQHFIGGHPMAGSEKTGFQNATDHLLENAYYALTPCAGTGKEALSLLEGLTRSLGAIPIILDPSEHDFAVASISHLPHMIASGLVNLVQSMDTENQIMKTIAAGGFKDITRIASASPVMWQQICLTNRENIVKTMEQYISYFTEVKEAVAQGNQDYLYDFFEAGRAYRDSIPSKATGPIETVYGLYCDLVDEAGSIARAASLLAEHNISIKNIGITHTREYQEEALHIEFYTKEASLLAARVLSSNHYTVTAT